MGRGRQKAKDAKIARQLKYTNHSVDLRDLEREIVSSGSSSSTDESDADDRWSEDDDR